VSLFVVSRPAKATDCEAIFEASNGEELDDIHIGNMYGAPLYEVSMQHLHEQNDNTLGAPAVTSAVHKSNESAQLRRNGVLLKVGQVKLPRFTARSEVFVGRTLYNVCSKWSGAIGEVLLYSRAVDDGELAAIESYLSSKWGCCSE
jgi:hypothetical protein